MQFIHFSASRKSNWFNRYSSQLLLVVILLVWTALLTLLTLNIQHSGKPLFGPGEVIEIIVENPDPSDSHSSESQSGNQPRPDPDEQGSIIKKVKDSPLPVGIGVGMIGAVIAVTFGAPVLVVTGVGAAVSIAGSYLASHALQ